VTLEASARGPLHANEHPFAEPIAERGHRKLYLEAVNRPTSA
jgi:hypothetical protein